MSKKTAFTLVELLIVIIIIAVLAAIAIPKLQDKTRQSEEAKVRADLRILRGAIERVYSDTSHYPLTLTALDDQAKPAKGKRHNGNNWLEPAMPNTWSGPYIAIAPHCPLDGYQYAIRFAPSGAAKIRVSPTGDAENDNNEPANPYFNW